MRAGRAEHGQDLHTADAGQRATGHHEIVGAVFGEAEE